MRVRGCEECAIFYGCAGCQGCEGSDNWGNFDEVRDVLHLGFEGGGRVLRWQGREQVTRMGERV